LIPVDLPIDEFEIVDPERTDNFPNVLVLTLEGVIPSAISAYGQRNLEDGRIATPALDSIARDSTIFTNARAAYPSTWDAWLMINTGRFIRVTEMDNILSFEDRYSRHNNLVKILRQTGVTRWCHAHSPAYSQIIVGPERHTINFEEDEPYAEITEEESERGMYRGEKHVERVARFLDSLEPGEKFYISEHMADSHFPWYRTEDAQAEFMGYPEGLSWAEKDGMQHDEDHLSYLQEVTRMDWQIGLMLEDLKERGLYEDLMIIIVGDHGCQWLEHGHKYYPGHLYDPALRIPVMIKFPGIEGRGEEDPVDVPVIQMDLLTTLADLAGVAHSNEEVTGPFPGCTLRPFMLGEETQADYDKCAQRDMLLSTHYDMVGFIDDFKYKLIADRVTGTYFLFDLVNDPGETENLVDSHPEVFEQMLEGLRQKNRAEPAFFAGVARSDSE